MELLWLLGVPASLFVGMALIGGICDWSIRRQNKWWAEPAYYATVIPVGLAMFGGITMSVILSFGAFQ